MDYDLTRLGAREFEHLTQALALQILGPGVQIYGDGPDGGREAEFRGEMRYPFPGSSDCWSGHGVLQAKFLQRPRGTKPDTTWFIGQVRKELRQWANKDSKRGREGALPRYLLFATNVVLSSDPVQGGLDLFEKAMSDLIDELKLPLEGFGVWHFDEICRYLDQYPAIRQTYAALTTAGDVLFKLREVIEGSASELGELLTGHSAKELATDQWVRLGQAGESDNQRLPLADMAIDPFSVSIGEDGSHQVGFTVRRILEHGDSVLRPSRRAANHPFIAVIGGPGQGKSTISQLLCQAYRVALLSDAHARLDPETARIVTEFQNQTPRMGISLPAARRWPVRVNLSEYADTIAGGESVSLLRHLASEISKRTSDVTPNQLRAWLRVWPWLVVFDGLDEVASPQARDAVMEKINDFVIDAHSVDADLLIVATSRPQGYRGEFSRQRYVQLTLEPLSADSAISYARQLTQARHKGDPDTAERVLQRLQEAADEDLTARLMVTPLQVTIMAILLERRERVPQQRYRLFNDYYQVIFNREVSKPGPIGLLIDDYRTQIDHLHERVGLFLQVQSEGVGDSDAIISREQLSRITQRHLKEEGYSDPDAYSLASRLVEAAMHRLILLVPKKGDSFGFEVRSLQEFMAAKALVCDDLSRTIDHLRMIAKSAHWRNTWLLAAGRIFLERPSFRDRLVNLLDEVQASDELSLFVKPGSMLAADLINDDVAARSPRFLRTFTKQALELVEEPLEEFQQLSLGEAIWHTGTIDAPSRAAIEYEISKSLAAGGSGRVNTLLLLSGEWQGRPGPLAYSTKTNLERARDQSDSIEFQMGIKILQNDFLVSGINNGTIKLQNREWSEVAESLLHVSASGLPDWVTQSLFGVGQVGYYVTEAGERVAVSMSQQPVRNLFEAMSYPGVVSLLVDGARSLPVEEWQVHHKLRTLCLDYQERIPAGKVLVERSRQFFDLTDLF
ncbi:NACHT domain-containing protein [Streptomyces sp. NPDC021012]|uniref:NACHT domain-containing protein n=1 Tax=Streptomyces sp. NPDC021012 TaxID=3365107 RepID=UPI00378B4359